MPKPAVVSGPLSRTRERVRVRARELRQCSPDAERHLWQRLRSRQLGGYKIRRQHPISRWFADFACVEAGLVIELDGGQHFSPAGLLADQQRSAGLSANGFRVLRFTDREALMEREAVLARVLDWLLTHAPQPRLHPHPNPLPRAGEGASHDLPLPRAGEGANHNLPHPAPDDDPMQIHKD